MIYEKGRLLQLWQRLKGRGPRFINIHGEDWHKQTKLRLGGPDAKFAFYAAAATGVTLTLTSGPISGALGGIAIAAGTVFGVWLSEKTTYPGVHRKLEKYGIDRNGKAFPPTEVTNLLQTTHIVYKASQHNAKFITSGLCGVNLFIIGLITFDTQNRSIAEAFNHLFDPYKNGNTLDMQSLIIHSLFSFPVGMCVHQLKLYSISKKLMDGDYVFCATPPPKTQTSEQKLPLGAQSHAPRLAPRIV